MFCHLVADAGRRLADLDLRLGGRVLRLDHFLLAAEGLDAGRERALVLDELLLLRLELLRLAVEVLQLLLDADLALERGAGEIFPAGADRLAGLRVELDDALLELLGLEAAAASSR